MIYSGPECFLANSCNYIDSVKLLLSLLQSVDVSPCSRDDHFGSNFAIRLHINPSREIQESVIGGRLS